MMLALFSRPLGVCARAIGSDITLPLSFVLNYVEIFSVF